MRRMIRRVLVADDAAVGIILQIVDADDTVVVRLDLQALLAIDADVVVDLELEVAEIAAHRLAVVLRAFAQRAGDGAHRVLGE